MAGGRKVKQLGADSISTAQVTLTSGAAQVIVAARQGRQSVYISNTSTAAPLYIGTATIIKTTGYMLPINGSAKLETNAAIYGTTSDAAAAAVVTYFEVY